MCGCRWPVIKLDCELSSRGVQPDGLIIGPINALGLHSDVTRVSVLAIEHWAGALYTATTTLARCVEDWISD